MERPQGADGKANTMQSNSLLARILRWVTHNQDDAALARAAARAEANDTSLRLAQLEAQNARLRQHLHVPGGATRQSEPRNMGLSISVTIGTIDMYGYNGREHHPRPEHEGQRAEVVAFRRVKEDLLFETDDQSVVTNYDFQVFTALLANGEMVELIDHEVQAFHITV